MLVIYRERREGGEKRRDEGRREGGGEGGREWRRNTYKDSKEASWRIFPFFLYFPILSPLIIITFMLFLVWDDLYSAHNSSYNHIKAHN